MGTGLAGISAGRTVQNWRNDILETTRFLLNTPVANSCSNRQRLRLLNSFLGVKHGVRRSVNDGCAPARALRFVSRTEFAVIRCAPIKIAPSGPRKVGPPEGGHYVL